MSLAAFFVSIFSSASYSAQQSFERVYDRMRVWPVNDATSSIVSLPLFIPVSDKSICSRNFMRGSSSPTISSVVLPISLTIPLTHLEVRGGIAFISADSSVATDPDLFVVDISGSSHILSSINTGPGISSFSLVGKRIFASAASTIAQLHVIGFSDTTFSGPLVVEGKYQLPLPYATATPPYATTISFGFNDGTGKIFLGTEKWDGDEFSIIDVSTPSSPSWRSGLEIGSRVTDIAVDSSIAYIANAGANQLINTVGGLFSPSGWSRQEGKVISIYDSRIIFGRTSGGYDIQTDHELFSLATTTGRSGVMSILSTKNILGGVYGIVQDDNHVYIATHEVGREFQIFDIASSSLALSSTSRTFSLPTQPQSMTCDGDTMYVLSHTSPYIYAIRF